MGGHIIIRTFRVFTIDILWNILYFPIWWYSTGQIKAAKFSWQQIIAMADYFALPILYKSLFKPMFGQADFWGRAISFGVRSVQLVVLTFVQLIWSALVFVAFLIWPLFPLFILYNLLFQFGFFSQTFFA